MVLDVIDPESLLPGYPVWTVPDVVLTPHDAGGVCGCTIELQKQFNAKLSAFPIRLATTQCRRQHRGLVLTGAGREVTHHDRVGDDAECSDEEERRIMTALATMQSAAMKRSDAS